jgi:hypothetical protein
MPDRLRYIPHPLEALAEADEKLDALAALVGACEDIGIVNRDGLALLLTRLAHDIEDATEALQRQQQLPA